MRLANFELDGERRSGVVVDDLMVDLSRSGLPLDTVDLIGQWDRPKLEHAVAQGQRLPLSQVRLLAPLVPRKNSLTP